MSNKKRIQKKISEIELMRFGKLAVSMSNIISFVKEWKEKQKSLKLVSGAVKPKGLITEEGKEMIVDITGEFNFNIDEDIKLRMNNSLKNTANSLRDMGKAIEKGNINFLENFKNIYVKLPKPAP